MPLTKIEAENFTVFKDITIPFGKGLNVLVGENGVGKTHIMKLAYAACKASKHDVSFSQKTTMLFRPDQSSIGRLVNRNKNGNNTAKVLVESDAAKIGMTFSTKTRKWDAEINSEEYYVNMMRAWFFQEAMVKRYDDAIKYLENKKLDKFTHLKTISKCVDSRKIDEKTKQYLKTLR